MKIRNTMLTLLSTLIFTNCGTSDKKQSESKKEEPIKREATFNAEVNSTPGNIISELTFTEKNGDGEKMGKRITKYFEDSSNVVITVFNKTGETIYDASIYTIKKADAKKLKADLTPMNDGSDNYTTYSPKDYGAVSLVFVSEGGSEPAQIISDRSMQLLGSEKKDETAKTNSLNFPVADFKTADEWVNKLKVSFKN